MSNVLQLSNIHRSFIQGGKSLEILKGVDLSLDANEVVGLVGPSGSGKSTLLQIAGLLEKPTTGEVLIKGKNGVLATESERTNIRRNDMGFVYQYHHLLPEFSALENVMMPQIIAGVKKSDASIRAKELLDHVGLIERIEHRPAELSGGEQQRVAIVRALANKPALLLADEPTGNLDPETAGKIFDLLCSSVKEQGSAALIVTHNHELAKKCDRFVSLNRGSVVA